MGLKLKKSAQLPFSKSFKRLWSASAASNFADGLLHTAAPLLATTLTQDPLQISLIGALAMLPWLLFAIPIGGIVDRFNRRQLLGLANLIRLSAALLLAISIGFELITFPILLLATFLFGIGEVMYDTTAQAMIPELLEAGQLERGNSKLEVTAVTLGEFVGAPVSGLLFAASIALPFFFGAAGVLVAVLLVMSMPKHYSIAPAPEKKPAREKFWTEIRFGIQYLYNHKVLLKLVLLTSSIGFFFSASGSTMVLFLTKTLGAPPAVFGFVFAAPALGALIGSLLATRASQRFGRTRTMAWGIMISSAMTMLQGFSPNYFVLAALLAIGSAVITFWNILLMSTYHEIIPTELFGRIHGTRRTLVWGMMPLGSLLGGLIALIDLRLPFIAGGAICLLLSIAGFRFIVRLKELTN